MSTTDDESFDWIERSGARAKGRRPQYFADPAIDRLVSTVLALTGEVAALRERLDTVERLLETKGSLSREDIETYAPDGLAGEERGLAMKAYIARVMRGMQQEVEALEARDDALPDVIAKLAEG